MVLIKRNVVKVPSFLPSRRSTGYSDRRNYNFGFPTALAFAIEPRERFVVPLSVIDEVMKRIQDESITRFVYDAAAGKLRLVDRTQ